MATRRPAFTRASRLWEAISRLDRATRLSTALAPPDFYNAGRVVTALRRAHTAAGDHARVEQYLLGAVEATSKDGARAEEATHSMRRGAVCPLWADHRSAASLRGRTAIVRTAPPACGTP